MIKIHSTQLWVHDQDAALEFYTTKLGMEIHADMSFPEFGSFRWLSVGPVGQPEMSIVLMPIPGEPVMDDGTKAQVEDLMGKGFAGTVFLVTEDIDGDYATLEARGVEFVEKPTDQPYGRDASFRDPSGNHLRITQLREM